MRRGYILCLGKMLTYMGGGTARAPFGLEPERNAGDLSETSILRAR